MLHALLLLAVPSFATGGEWQSLSVHPAAWGCGVETSQAAPAGLARIEGFELAATGARADGEGSVGLLGGSRLGPIHFSAGGCLDGGIEAEDGGSEFFVSVARVVTGDPVGFIEGFYGPSIAVGASATAALPGEGDPIMTGVANVQFSVFPTFALGLAVSGLPISVPGEVENETGLEWAATYIFSRELRVHAALSGGDASIGAEVRVGDHLRARSGTDGTDWSAGAGLVAGDFSVDYGMTMTGTDLVHAVTVGFSHGGEDWY